MWVLWVWGLRQSFIGSVLTHPGLSILDPTTGYSVGRAFFLCPITCLSFGT